MLLPQKSSRERSATRRADFDQCKCRPLVDLGLSLTFKKGTTFLSNFGMAELAKSRQFDPEPREGVPPTDGDRGVAPHPPLRGKEKYLLGRRWNGDGTRRKSEWLTGATAYYPAELTWQLVGRLTAEACKWFLKHQASATEPAAQPAERGPMDHSGRPKVQQCNPLAGQTEVPVQHQLGSLRNIATSVEAIPGHRVVGGRVRDVLTAYLAESPGLDAEICSTIGGDRELGDVLTNSRLMEVRSRLYRLFADSGFPVTTPRPDKGTGEVSIACNLLVESFMGPMGRRPGRQSRILAVGRGSRRYRPGF